MDSSPVSTIAALCYVRNPEIAFDALTATLSSRPWRTDGGDALDMPTQEFAQCDASGQRIGLARVALDRTFPGTPTGRHFPSCLLVSVGPDGTLPATATQPRHDRVLADLLLRLQEIATADRVLMFERTGVWDSALHDTVVDALRGHLDKVLMPRAAAATGPRAAPRAASVAMAQAGSAQTAAIAATGDDTAIAAQAGGAPRHADTRPVSCPGTASRVLPPAALSPATLPSAALPPAPSLVPPLAPSRSVSSAMPGAPATTPAAPLSSTPSTAAPDDIVQLAERLETELDRLQDARRTLDEGDIAERPAPRRRGLRRGLPPGFPRLAPAATRLFAPKPDAARDSRPETAYPDYEDMPANINERPLLHRAAVNALNVSVMTIALPVGAALLTMSALGREDMLTSSRVTAVTGVAVALHNTGAASWMQSLFL